jgi:hypothetical protein
MTKCNVQPATLAPRTLVFSAGAANLAAVALPGAIGLRIARATAANVFFSMSWFKPYFFNSQDESAEERARHCASLPCRADRCLVENRAAGEGAHGQSGQHRQAMSLNRILQIHIAESRSCSPAHGRPCF